MTVADTELENMHKSVMEEKAETQSMEDKADQKLSVKTNTSCCSGLKAFLAALAFTYFSKVFSGAMMKSSFTQLERRFAISSSTAGFMDGGFEIGNCYRYDTSSRTSDNFSSSVSPCLVNETTLGLEKRPVSDCDETVTSYAWVFVLMGNLLRGIGETPIAPLGMSYLDDFSREEDTPFYVGILHTIAMIGPMAGFLLGSVLAKIYVDVGFVDLGTITITPTDSRWVGAWWLGFLAAAVTNLISGIPFLFLPKTLEKEGGNAPGTKKLDAVKMKDHNHESHKHTSETQQEEGNSLNLKGFFKSLKRVLGNGRYFTLLCVSLLQFNSFIGYLTYNTKYMEQQYGQPASKSNLVTGVAVLPAVSIGIFAGGLIMKKYKLNVIAATKMAFITSFLAFAISLFYMTVFHNCSCIETMDSVVINSSAVLGECPRNDDCSRKFIYFTVIKVASSFFYALGGTSFFMIMIRNIEPELKSLAVGLHMLVMRALGGIPAPVYFGAVIDRACLKWANTGCSRQGACRLYDSTVFRQKADIAENGMKEGAPMNGEMKPNDNVGPPEADMDTCI
ncbi:hypothetical protein JD844_028798 [Phrynosoma platyrhinos]|uniref:Solute carrier organic anion transporter family member n=1 Tax=Phrynosoma platyrhinos TaxID=52577 RepID=A0ABQ7SIH5_PHRPL|nr:hypothetical protein JD844_028798 [Phrynosoma platyrhinos]